MKVDRYYYEDQIKAKCHEIVKKETNQSVTLILLVFVPITYTTKIVQVSS